jgi:hypothetical protein
VVTDEEAQAIAAGLLAQSHADVLPIAAMVGLATKVLPIALRRELGLCVLARMRELGRPPGEVLRAIEAAERAAQTIAYLESLP